jgi:hypothetical protein
MKWISGFLVAVVVGLVLAALNGKARKAEAKMGGDHFTIRFPKMILGISIGSLIIMVFIIIIIPIFSEDTNGIWIFYVVMSIVMFGCLFLFWYVCRWQMVVANDKITITPAFGKERIVSIWDIAQIQRIGGNAPGIKAFGADGKKLFRIDTNAAGYYPLIQKIEQLRPEFTKN